MGKKIIKYNVHVEVEIKSYVRIDPEQEIIDCQHMVDQIKRHVDDVGNCLVNWDIEVTCEFCGYGWEVNTENNDPDYPVGMPLCCRQAQKEFEDNQKGD